jgi:ADP-ribosylglycohydrolase
MNLALVGSDLNRFGTPVGVRVAPVLKLNHEKEIPMSTLTLNNRIRGALIGAVVGAELSFGRTAHPQAFEAVQQPTDLFKLTLEPGLDWKPEKNNQWAASVTPLIALGVRTYLTAKGRATPEDFAALFKDDPGVAAPAFAFDGLHTIQELLKEGMHPRLSGLNNAPSGLVAACMVAVGIFHCADPERAYLDGVELASVAQCRLGADWAALCAVAVAAAFELGATGESVIDAVLKIAHANHPDLYYQINTHARRSAGFQQDADFAQWWWAEAGVVPASNAYHWIAPNPIRFTLPPLGKYAHDPLKLMQVLIGANPGERWFADMIGVHAVPAVIAGAVAGALGGEGAFPAEWLAWAVPIAAPWFELSQLVQGRLAEEQIIIHEIEILTRREGQADSRLHDKLKGALLAGAIGNAMGSPVESRMFWDIDKQYPSGVRTILDPKRLESEDDNQMAMLLVETYLERDGLPVMARHFGHTWYERLDRDHFFPLCMGNSYDLIRAGQDPRITGHWNNVTGSTVMCMEPVGIFNLADPLWASQDAIAISYMYQRGVDVTAAAMLAATVANALRADASVDSVLQAALDVAPRTPLHTFDNRPFKSVYDYIGTCLGVADKYTDVMDARKELYDRCLLYHMIDPLELWGLALAMFMIAHGDVRQAAIGGTNIGRDSDTIAGRAAMLSGALMGVGGIPQEDARRILVHHPAVVDVVVTHHVENGVLHACAHQADGIGARLAELIIGDGVAGVIALQVHAVHPHCVEQALLDAAVLW